MTLSALTSVMIENHVLSIERIPVSHPSGFPSGKHRVPAAGSVDGFGMRSTMVDQCVIQITY